MTAVFRDETGCFQVECVESIQYDGEKYIVFFDDGTEEEYAARLEAVIK